MVRKCFFKSLYWKWLCSFDKEHWQAHLYAHEALSPGLKDKTQSSPAMQASQVVWFSSNWQQSEGAGSVLLY